MARSIKELEAWAQLLELCDDGCRVFDTTPAMRSACLEVERELIRLHKMEDCAIRFARLFKALRDNQTQDREIDHDKERRWENAMETLWETESDICALIERLLPEAFTPEAMATELVRTT